VIRPILAALVALALLASPAHTQTAKTKAALTTEVNGNFPDQLTGAVSPALARSTFLDFIASWQQFPSVNAQTGTTYTFLATDYGKLVTFNNAASIAVTLPQATGSFNPWGTQVVNLGAGVVTITPTTSTICGASTLALAQNQSAYIVGDGTNYQCVQSLSALLSATSPLNLTAAGVLSINTNGIGYTLEAQAATNTVVGNATSGTANKTDLAVGTCSGTGNALIWTTNTGFGCATLTATFNSRGGAVSPAAGDYTLNQIYNCTLPPQGRLTFLTGVPVQTATTSGATSHFYTPYIGQQVPIWDGTRFNCVDTGGELTQTAADNTKSPAAVANNSCYDVFVWSDSGTIRATRGKVWTNVTTRADALIRKNGILVNNVSVTNGPAQFLGTYVGTECSNGSATFDWIIGAAASGGTAASLNVWNEYNRVEVATIVTDSGAGYTYGTVTIRQARASAGNQITFVSGNSEDGVEAFYTTNNVTSATAGDGVDIGIGLDSTTTFSGTRVRFNPPTSNAATIGLGGSWALIPQTGRHTISANEQATAAVNSTFDNLSDNALSFKFRM
jgi:hypothetical protein